jgi:hypothetical protein
VAQEELKVVVKVQLDEAKAKMAQFSKTIQNLKQNYLNVSFAVKDFYAILKKVGNFVWDFAEAGIAAEKSERMLQSALRASGQEYQKNAKLLNAYASAMAQSSFFDDEEIKDAMATLTTIGRVSAEGMKQIMPVIQDFAAAMGMDLGSAADLVSKALAGNVGALGRYGIKLKDTGSEVGNFNQIVKQMGEQFKGADEALSKTTEGSLKQLKEQLAEIKESIGGKILDFLKPTIEYMSLAAKTENALKIQVGDIKSKEEAKAYLDILKQAVEMQKKADADKGKMGAIQRYFSGASISESTKWIAEYQNKIEAIQRQMTKLGQSKPVSPMLGEPEVAITEQEAMAKMITQLSSLEEEFKNLSPAMENTAARWKELGIQATYGFTPEVIDKTAQSLDNLTERWVALGRALEPVAKEFQEDIFLNFNWEQMRANNEAFISQLEAEKTAIDDLNKSLQDMLKNMAQDAFISTFTAMGEALGGNADSAKNFAAAMQDIINDFLAQLPRLLFQAGIMQLAQGNTPLGLGLLAASGLSALVGGAVRSSGGAAEGAASESGETGGKTIIIQGDLVTENDVTKGVLSRAARW